MSLERTETLGGKVARFWKSPEEFGRPAFQVSRPTPTYQEGAEAMSGGSH